MEGIEGIQSTNSMIEAWQAQQNTQLALATAVMKQGLEVANVQGEAIVKMIEEMPRMDGSGHLIQKSA
jgi:hypothetical protein